MRKKVSVRILTILLCLVMVSGLFPATAFAASSAPSSSTVRSFDYPWPMFPVIRTSAGTEPARCYHDWAPFDRESGYPLFCVDPGVAVDYGDGANYQFTVGHGDELVDIIASAEAHTDLGNTTYGNAAYWDDITDPTILETLSQSKLDDIMQMMSVFYANKGQSFNSPDTANTGFSQAAYIAVQFSIWVCVDTMQRSLAQMINEYDTLPEGPGGYFQNGTGLKAKDLWAALNAILEEKNRVYSSDAGEAGVAGSMRFVNEKGSNRKTYGNEASAKANPYTILFNSDSDSTQEFTLTPKDDATKASMNLIHYVAINDNIQPFEAGNTAKIDNNFSITRNGDDSVKVTIVKPETDGEGNPIGDSPVYTVQFLQEDKIPEPGDEAIGKTYTDDSWAIFARGNSRKQSFFGAYTPAFITGAQSIAFVATLMPSFDAHPVFPTFILSQHKKDNAVGYDSDSCTAVGGSSLAAEFMVQCTPDIAPSQTLYSEADVYGHGASVTVFPWGKDGDEELVSKKTTTMGEWQDPDAMAEWESSGSNPDDEPEKIEFESKYEWDASCDITVTESGAPTGHDGTGTTYTYHITYHAETPEREAPDEEWGEIEYTISVSGDASPSAQSRVSALTDDNSIMATWDDPCALTDGDGDVFINTHHDGDLQIIKTQATDDIFSAESGKGTMAGGVVSGKNYSTNSKWTIRVIDASATLPNVSVAKAAEMFEGYEDCPYIKVVESKEQNKFMHCYDVMTDGTGTPADEEHPLTPSEFGQISVSHIPYGTYLVTEIKADKDRYVKESMVIVIDHDGQVISTDIHNADKENVVKVVKVDSETGKTIPSAKTAFRIRYMGSPEDEDPTKTPNYGRYLPNASNILSSAGEPEDYIFYTDEAGEITIRYELPYGIYQLEEILVPEGYYVGTYDETGVVTGDERDPERGIGSEGQSESYGEGDDNHQTYGEDMTFTDRVAIYDAAGNKVDYTNDGNIVYNYYTFEVTKQDDHTDGEDYHTYTLTVEMKNTAAKGKIEISKVGEVLVGFKQVTDDYGNTVYEPVYEHFPLPDVTFGIYAAEDVLLQDGEEAPKAYDKLTDEEVEMVIESIKHLQFPDADIVSHGTHATSGAEIFLTRQRDKSENNVQTVEYLTPLQKGTIYTASFSRYDDELGLTYDYDIEFGLEYTAGGWNYTDIKVKRTITGDDYMAYIPDDLPTFYNGEEEVPLSSAVFENNNKMELNGPVSNDYDFSTDNYELVEHVYEFSLVTPEITDIDSVDSLTDSIVLPEGYHLGEITNTRITAISDEDLQDVLVAVNSKVPCTCLLDRGPAANGCTCTKLCDHDAPNPDCAVCTNNVEDCAVKCECELCDTTCQENCLKAGKCTCVHTVIEWKSESEVSPSDYYTPRYKQDVVSNLPEFPDGVEFAGASRTTIYVTDSRDGTPVQKAVFVNADGEYGFYLPDRSDMKTMEIEVPDGYEGDTSSAPIVVSRDLTPEEAASPLFKGLDARYKVYIHDLDTGEYRWVDCTRSTDIYKVRVQEFDVTLTQHNESTDGWKFEMDGVVLENVAVNEDTATATITLPYDVTPTISDSVGCDIVTDTLDPVGTKTTITIKHPDAPVYFKMIDGTTVEMVHLGGYTKTTLKVPAGNEIPSIYRDGEKLDILDEENGGLTPSHNKQEIIIDGQNYIRVTRCEASVDDGDTYYEIELVSNATSETGAFLVKYHGAFESTSIVVPDAVTGAQRGNLQFRAIDKTMRYPLSDLVETITTNEDGVATSSLLPLGDYIVRELSAPDGFVVSETAYPVSLQYKNQFTPLVWASADAENGAVSVQLDITKGFQRALNSDEYELKDGAVFGVYTYNAIYSSETPADSGNVDALFVEPDTLVATVTVGEDGKAMETIKLPKGDYYVKEISTRDGYELNNTRFIFRVDDSVKSGTVDFAYESMGMFGTIRHMGYKTVDIELSTYFQYPYPVIVVNDIDYPVNEPLAAKTVGNGVLVENIVDADRSVLHITGSVDKPVTVVLPDGSEIIVTVGEVDYTVEFVDAAGTTADIEISEASNITEVAGEHGGKAYHYDPTVAATGYLAESSTIYTAPQTKLISKNGTSLEWMYDLINGVKKAVITYPRAWNYYSNEDLPLKDVEYYYGDIDQDGKVEEDDLNTLRDYVSMTGPVPVLLTDNQFAIADMNDSGTVDEEDVKILERLLVVLDVISSSDPYDGEDPKLEYVTVQEPYLPDDAILFETEGFGNVAYVGSAIDLDARTITIDLSKLTEAKTVKVGEAVIHLDGDTISLTGETVTAVNTRTNAPVTDGYQPDGLTLSGGNTLASPDTRTLALSSLNGTNEVQLVVNYDHSFMDMSITHGTLTAAWLNDENKTPGDLAGKINMAPGNTATLIFDDNTVYHIELSNTGYVYMSAENIVNGGIANTGATIPTLKVNGSADNFIDVDYQVITQAIPMDETSLDVIRQHNTKNVTFARADGMVKQLQVKINSVGTPEDRTGEPAGTIPNDLRPYISKVDATTARELPGAKIEIYNALGETIASGYSDENGKFYFDKPEPGTYTFREISAPSGYVVNEEVFEFTVNPDGTIVGDDTITDERIPTPHYDTPKMTLHKTDAVTGQGLPNATFEVLNEDRTHVVAAGKSDSNGDFTFDRPEAGIYWFHETSAPDGYILSHEMFQFVVEPTGEVTGDDTITNERMNVIISKVDVTNGAGVPGAYIEVYDETGAVIASGYSDEDGHFEFEKPEPGVYTFREVTAPWGYLLNEEVFTFTVHENGSVTGDDTIDDIPRGLISKLDVTTSEGIPGAEIEILDEDGNVIESGISDENGNFFFPSPLPGTYWFHETVAPDGYFLNEEMFTFEVLEDGTIVGDCTITDVPKEIVVQKVESISYKPLTGATISFWDENGALVSAGVSDEDGKVYFAAPAVGTYIYREDIAPDGYILDEKTHIITIHPNGTITGELVLVNEPYVPRTGVKNWIPVLFGVGGIALAALAATVIVDIRKRKQRNH